MAAAARTLLFGVRRLDDGTTYASDIGPVRGAARGAGRWECSVPLEMWCKIFSFLIFEGSGAAADVQTGRNRGIEEQAWAGSYWPKRRHIDMRRGEM